MRQSIRILGWTITICTILVFGFLATSVYSLMQMLVADEGIRIEGFETQFAEDGFVLSVTIAVNNTSYLNIAELNISSLLSDSTGNKICEDNVFIHNLASGESEIGFLNMSLDIVSLLSSMPYLFFEDSDFGMDMYLEMKYASLEFQLAVVNQTFPWGAPIHNLTLGGINTPYFNGSAFIIDIAFSFQNHSFLNLIGFATMQIYNSERIYLGQGRQTLNVMPTSEYNETLQLTIENFGDFTPTGYIQISFESAIFGIIELGEIEYG